MGRIVDTADVLAYGNLEANKLGKAAFAFERCIDSAERFVERYTGRRFSPDPVLDSNGADTLSPVTKRFSVTPSQSVIRVPDLRAVTAATLNGTAVTQADAFGSGGYSLDNYADQPALRVYLTAPSGLLGGSVLGTLWSGPGVFAITGRWGWLEPPEDIVTVVYALVMRMWRERDAAWADSVATPDGSVMSYFRQLPASQQGVLQMFKSGPKIAFV